VNFVGTLVVQSYRDKQNKKEKTRKYDISHT